MRVLWNYWLLVDLFFAVVLGIADADMLFRDVWNVLGILIMIELKNIISWSLAISFLFIPLRVCLQNFKALKLSGNIVHILSNICREDPSASNEIYTGIIWDALGCSKLSVFILHLNSCDHKEHINKGLFLNLVTAPGLRQQIPVFTLDPH